MEILVQDIKKSGAHWKHKEFNNKFTKRNYLGFQPQKNYGFLPTLQCGRKFRIQSIILIRFAKMKKIVLRWDMCVSICGKSWSSSRKFSRIRWRETDFSMKRVNPLMSRPVRLWPHFFTAQLFHFVVVFVAAYSYWERPQGTHRQQHKCLAEYSTYVGSSNWSG